MTDDPRRDRRQTDLNFEQFKAHVHDHFDFIDRKIASLEVTAGTNERMIAENTKLTKDAAEAVTALRDEVQPMVDAIKAARNGLVKIGKASDWLDKWGRRFVKLAIWAIAIWLGLKMYLQSGSFAQAVDAFVKGMR
jgi:hypothetical protein